MGGSEELLGGIDSAKPSMFSSVEVCPWSNAKSVMRSWKGILSGPCLAAAGKLES